MSQTVEVNPLQRELSKFLVVAEVFKANTGKQAFMPACPVDTEWHQFLEHPDNYNTFCHEVVGREVRHEPAKGEGEVEWTGTYEAMFGPLPEVWFRDTNGVLNQANRRRYLEEGTFYAAWDCTPY